MTDERDPVVGEALDAIGVPAATDDFWATFESRLADAEPPTRATDDDGPLRLGASGPDQPAEGRDLTVVPLARRARPGQIGPGRRRRYAVAAVAAAVVIAVALARRPSDEPEEEVASQPESSAALSVPADDAPAASTMAKLDPSTPEGAVTLWLDALAAGDLAAAEALTGPRTTAYEAALGRSPAEFLASYAEPGSWVAWAGAVDRTVRAVAVGELEGQAAQVVVLQGTYELDGVTAPRLDAFPVLRNDDGTWAVEINAFDPGVDGRLETITPPAGPDGLEPLAAGRDLEVAAPDPGTYVAAIDDRPAQRETVEGSGFDQVVRFSSAGLEPGEHVLVLARLSPTQFTAIAVPLTISEA